MMIGLRPIAIPKEMGRFVPGLFHRLVAPVRVASSASAGRATAAWPFDGMMK
eukprot:CAMPEP_0176071432 /NCGR_PEP_ID=MMETSP0120_2-20121206/35678_1 /TAXON_ID=160619 /ORGANISM="Kryptoperidinium foliaceum, Strain CCMP 1326" /LENGTH=51 /DNA_ID=CAMNT_0017405089 /DNA_START=202 /DNA_END=357 /DNA_ORIENTATION=+